MPVRALPLELLLAVAVALGDELAAAEQRDLLHLVQRVAQPRVRAALAPMALTDGVRHREPAVPCAAFPFQPRQAVDVVGGQAAPAVACGVALDFVEGELAHRVRLLVVRDGSSVSRAGAVGSDLRPRAAVQYSPWRKMSSC
jgi:hypothetical protein